MLSISLHCRTAMDVHTAKLGICGRLKAAIRTPAGDESSHLPKWNRIFSGFVQVIFTVDQSVRAIRTGQPCHPSDILGANPR